MNPLPPNQPSVLVQHVVMFELASDHGQRHGTLSSKGWMWVLRKGEFRYLIWDIIAHPFRRHEGKACFLHPDVWVRHVVVTRHDSCRKAEASFLTALSKGEVEVLELLTNMCPKRF